MKLSDSFAISVFRSCMVLTTTLWKISQLLMRSHAWPTVLTYIRGMYE